MDRIEVSEDRIMGVLESLQIKQVKHDKYLNKLPGKVRPTVGLSTPESGRRWLRNRVKQRARHRAGFRCQRGMLSRFLGPQGPANGGHPEEGRRTIPEVA